MKKRKLNALIKDKTGKELLDFIPNKLGINLCSVADIRIYRQKNGETKRIDILFAPEEPEEKKDSKLLSDKHFYVSA